MRKAKLLEMAARCERVPMQPAISFLDAVQSVYFYFCYNYHGELFGAVTGPTPDGRKAGEAISFGSGPAMNHGNDTAPTPGVVEMDVTAAGRLAGR